MKRLNQKGFTLAELLIVVAIIAVLVAIAIPVFSTQLEKSRETTDIANIRSAYAAGTVKALSGDDDGTFYFAPKEDGSLSSTAVNIGQGTGYDGKADVSSLPGNADYKTAYNVRNSPIQIVIENGTVKSIAFTQS